MFPSVKKRLPDLVVRLADGSIFHLELQSDTDEIMVWRMLEYYVLIRSLYPDAVLIQQVLYVGPKRPSFTPSLPLGWRNLLKTMNTQKNF